MDIRDEKVCLRAIKKTLQVTATELIPEVLFEEQDRRTSVIQKLTYPSSFMVVRKLKDFTLIDGDYFQGNNRVFAHDIFNVASKEELKCIHDLSCRNNDVNLYKHLQRRGYY